MPAISLTYYRPYLLLLPDKYKTTLTMGKKGFRIMHIYREVSINHHDLSQYPRLFLMGPQLHCAVVADLVSQNP